ncbi:MAG: hypothetical protein IKZ28_06875, partial [Clostridia bacterium]|nr:hypothetical protein [Clostridia bacterium]
NGKFVMRADDENRWADCQRVSVTGTELEYDGSNRTNGANIVGDRGLYIVPAYGKATALVYTVPENVTEPTVITLRGSDVFRKEEGTGNIRFRIILNDRVLYTGDCSVAQENLDVNLRFTVKAGDKIYFAVDCTTEENSNTAVYMTSAIYIDGMYLDASKCNHVNPANSTKACEKNFFNGVLYNGERYTYADIFSYEAIEIKEIA